MITIILSINFIRPVLVKNVNMFLHGELPACCSGGLPIIAHAFSSQ